MQFHAALDGAPELVQESVLRAELSNGSRIIALPGGSEGKTVRGYSSVSLAVVDEASRVEDALFAAIRPMLGVADGSLLMLSTPAGKRGEFYRAWTDGGDLWHRTRVDATECPRLSQEFLDEELAELGPTMFAQEYLLQFIDDAEMVFSTSLIDSAFTDEVQPLWN
jgi:Terminase large subunit, T4likevirus-type, N-terminal